MDGTILNKKLKIEEKLAQLNEIAQKVDDMPTFTSNDRAFLEELPGFPATDGKKVLTATTESGETSLAYEEVESGENQVYSTTPVKVGTWIDNRGIYRVVYQPDSAIVVANNNWTDIGMSVTGIDVLLDIAGIAADGACCDMTGAKDNGKIICLAARADGAFTAAAFIVNYVEQVVTKRSKK